MSRRFVFPPECLHVQENVRFVPPHNTMADFFGAGGARYSSLHTLDGISTYPTPFEYVEWSDDDDDDDDDDDGNEHSIYNSRYCGFNPNFLDRAFTKPSLKASKRVTPEEAAKNAKELLDEEEKLKKKAEKKKLKKMRQRERRRQEKLEKENAEKDTNKQVVPGPVKSKAAEKSVKSEECEYNNIKPNNNTHVDPVPGQQHCEATESSESDENDDDKDGLAADPEELDMNSCFVTNAAAIAKRKIEQNPKFDWKDKKAESFGQKQTTKPKSAAKPLVKNDGKANDCVKETEKDFVTRSMELAVKGNTYAEKGNLDMAVKYFTDAIKHNPKEFKLFGNRSFCYEKMQQYDKALIDADIALSLNPTWIKGLYRKGRALVGLKKYYEAGLTYKKVLKLDSSCTDAAQELMRVQIMQLMDMGFTREQSSNALIIHGTVEKALEALSGIQGSMAAARVPAEACAEKEWICLQKNPQKVPLKTVSQNQLRAGAASKTAELFPIWVGDLVPALSEAKIYNLFKTVGPVHSVKVLQAKRCAFVNYTNKEDCEKAIQAMHGYPIEGTILVVRYPDKIATHLGVSKTASTDTGTTSKVHDECHFWRTTGCIKNNRCSYKHVPEHKGIDLGKAK